MSEPYEHADYVRRLVDQAPPFSPEQIARLSILLSGTPALVTVPPALEIPEQDADAA